jgi:hypothetical protein
MPLAAVGPLAQVLGSSVLGVRLPFGGAVYRAPLGRAVIAALVSYAFLLVGVYVLGLIIDALAPKFGGTRSPTQALKTAAYASTAGWLAGVFTLVPGLQVLVILGLYSIYLLYLGLPVMMQAAADRAGAYTGVVILAGFALFFLGTTVGLRLVGGWV